MKIFLIALKLAVTAALVWILLEKVDLAPVGTFLRSGRVMTAMAACVGILIVQALMATVRLRWIMRLMDAALPASLGFSTWMSGLLVSQVTFLAGDATRIWQLAQHGFGRRRAGSAIFLERALGFAVLMAMVLFCMPFLLPRTPQNAVQVGLLTLSGLCVIGIVGFIASAFVGRVVTRLVPRLAAGRVAAAVTEVASAARHLSVSWPLTVGIILVSAAMHLCNALAFYVLSVAAGLNLDLATTTIIALPVMLIALMPIALAGWGVREGAAVVGFGLFGVAPQTATAISVTFGLALMLASLPGGFYLWFGKSDAKSSAQPPSEAESESLTA